MSTYSALNGLYKVMETIGSGKLFRTLDVHLTQIITTDIEFLMQQRGECKRESGRPRKKEDSRVRSHEIVDFPKISCTIKLNFISLCWVLLQI